MSEDPSSSPSASNRTSEKNSDKSWLEKLLNTFSTEPKSRLELLDIIKYAADSGVIETEELEIIQGALDVADMQVREIQIPRSQMVVIRIDESPDSFLPKIIESAHSRFPVVGESTEDVRGILLAKDLLPLILQGCENFELKDIIRPAQVIPESKRLNVLLREFRENRYHMAMVIDEYGGISGLVTIEDILEEIVGEIEDETDDEEQDAFIRKVSDTDYIVKALTPIEEFNEFFEANFSEDESVTIGGILMRSFGHLPQRNEATEIDGYQFKVLYSDNRQIHLVRLTPPAGQ